MPTGREENITQRTFICLD